MFSLVKLFIRLDPLFTLLHVSRSANRDQFGMDYDTGRRYRKVYCVFRNRVREFVNDFQLKSSKLANEFIIYS